MVSFTLRYRSFPDGGMLPGYIDSSYKAPEDGISITIQHHLSTLPPEKYTGEAQWDLVFIDCSGIFKNPTLGQGFDAVLVKEGDVITAWYWEVTPSEGHSLSLIPYIYTTGVPWEIPAYPVDIGICTGFADTTKPFEDFSDVTPSSAISLNSVDTDLMIQKSVTARVRKDLSEFEKLIDVPVTYVPPNPMYRKGADITEGKWQISVVFDNLIFVYGGEDPNYLGYHHGNEIEAFHGKSTLAIAIFKEEAKCIKRPIVVPRTSPSDRPDHPHPP